MMQRPQSLKQPQRPFCQSAIFDYCFGCRCEERKKEERRRYYIIHTKLLVYKMMKNDEKRCGGATASFVFRGSFLLSECI